MFLWQQEWFCLRLCASAPPKITRKHRSRPAKSSEKSSLRQAMNRSWNLGVSSQLNLRILEIDRSGVVLDQREDVQIRQFCAAVQEGKFYGESRTTDRTTERPHEFHCGCRGTSGRQQIVTDENALARSDSIFVD